MELEQYLKQHLASSTIKRYQREIKLYQEYLKKQNKTAEQANYNEVMEYIGYLRKHKNSVACSLHGIKKYYDYLVASGKRKDNPSSSIRLRDRPSKDIQIQDFFTSQELEKLLERKNRYSLLINRNKLVISLLIYQGLTNGEIKRLELKDVNLEEGTIYVKQSIRTNRRTLKLESKQVYYLMNYLEKDRKELLKVETEKLIISKRGSEENGEGISYLIETMRSKFPERKLNPKTIRQSVIANLLKQGKDLRLVQYFAGHKYPSTTERYKQSQVEELKKEVLKYHPLG